MEVIRMSEQAQAERIAKYIKEFEAYSERAQGMQLMLAMCLKAGMPMPFADVEEIKTSTYKPDNNDDKKGA